jgi:hypothetical protein
MQACPPGYVWLPNIGCYSTTPVPVTTSKLVAWIEWVLEFFMTPLGLILLGLFGGAVILWYFRGEAIKAWWEKPQPTKPSSTTVTLDPWSWNRLEKLAAGMGYPPPPAEYPIDGESASAAAPNGARARQRTSNLPTNQL